MIYISKGKEPPKLTKYKKTPEASYKGFSKANGKEDVQIALLEEQGYLCAYCMQRINLDSIRIEHQVPQSDETQGKSLELSYDNMLGVCQGKINSSLSNLESENYNPYCEANRGDKPLKINPRDKNTINKIKYSAIGEIYSEDEEIQIDLDKTLKLNIQPLRKNRKAVREGIIQHLENKYKTINWSKGILEKELANLRTKNIDTDKKLKLKEYCGIAIYVLQKRLDRA